MFCFFSKCNSKLECERQSLLREKTIPIPSPKGDSDKAMNEHVTSLTAMYLRCVTAFPKRPQSPARTAPSWLPDSGHLFMAVKTQPKKARYMRRGQELEKLFIVSWKIYFFMWEKNVMGIEFASYLCLQSWSKVKTRAQSCLSLCPAALPLLKKKKRRGRKQKGKQCKNLGSDPEVRRKKAGTVSFTTRDTENNNARGRGSFLRCVGVLWCSPHRAWAVVGHCFPEASRSWGWPAEIYSLKGPPP